MFSGCPGVQLCGQHYVAGTTGWGAHLRVLLLFIALHVCIHGHHPCVGLLSGCISLLSSWALAGEFAVAFPWHSLSLCLVMCQLHPVHFVVDGQLVSWQEGGGLTWVPIPFPLVSLISQASAVEGVE